MIANTEAGRLDIPESYIPPMRIWLSGNDEWAAARFNVLGGSGDVEPHDVDVIAGIRRLYDGGVTGFLSDHGMTSVAIDALAVTR